MKYYPPFSVQILDVIPYSCYYDQNTIITKNGELLQTLEIKFPSKSGKREHLNYALRCAINKVNNKNIAFWINIVRDKMIIDNNENTSNRSYFANKLITEWNKKNNWQERTFENKIYITIVAATQKTKLLSMPLFFNSLKKKQRKNFIKNYSSLVRAVKTITENLDPYNVRLLSIIKEDQKYYSEHIELYQRILYAYNERVELEISDLSHLLQRNRKVVVDFNNIVSEKKERKKYIACFCIKSYQQMSDEYIYQITNLEQTASFTEIITFVENSIFIKNLERHCYLLKSSGANNLSEALMLNQISEDMKKDSKVIAYDQIMINIASDSLEDLQNRADKIEHLGNDLGVSIVRLDMHLERGFWSQLPGNFNYIINRHPVNKKQMIQLPIMDTEISGNIYNVNWGRRYIALLTNQYNMVYFFNFFLGKIGHTAVFGDDVQRTVFLNFILTQALYKKEKVILLDYNQKSRIFINIMDGKYLIIANKHNKTNKTGINFLQLEDTKEARQTIKKCLEIISGKTDLDWVNLIEKIMNVPIKERTLSAIKDILIENKIDITDWYADGKYGGIFDNEYQLDVLSHSSSAVGIDITKIADNHISMKAFMRYILYLIETQCNEDLVILVFNEAVKMNQNNALTKNIEKWLYNINKKNILVVFSASYNDLADASFVNIHSSLLPTQIMFPEKGAYRISKLFKIEDYEERWLKTTRPLSGKFILKYGDRMDIMEFDVRNIKTIGMLYSTPSKIQKMIEIKTKNDGNKKKWIQEMIGVVDEEIQ